MGKIRCLITWKIDDTGRYASILVHYTLDSFDLRESLRCNIHTHAPMSLSLRVTSSAMPPPPATSMLALSGSRAAKVCCRCPGVARL